MKALLGAVACFLLFAVVLGQTSQNCTQFSSSCGKCYMAGCSYYWGRPGLYNSAVNGSCVSTAVFNDMMWNNQYSKTVFAYALREDEVNTTLGQRKLSVLDSAKNYLARPVLCFDRHLCYCKPMPPPPPSRLIVNVVDSTNLRPIQGAIVMVNANLTGAKTTPVSGAVEYFPIPYGSYIANASAEGYTSNSKPTGAIGANMTVEITIPLDPLPCTITVRTFSNPGKVVLPGVSVALGIQPTRISPDNGTLVYTLQTVDSSGVVGTIAGYQEARGNYVCTRGGTPVVELIFDPIPNQVTIQVRDRRSDLPIPSASVSFTGFAVRGVDANARTVYTNIAAGTYTAGASATGYISNNSVTVGPLTFAQDVTYIIYLTELPCGVTVTVVNSRNNAPIAGAAVALNDGASRGNTSAAGTIFFSILFDAANNVSASKIGFNDGWKGFDPVCQRGVNISVTVPLVEVLLLKIAARDVASPSQPYIMSAEIKWNSVILTKSDPEAPQFRLLEVQSLPVAGVIDASARGFNPKTTSYTWTEDGARNFTVSLAPQQFTLFFIPQELIFDSTVSTSTGINSNISNSGTFTSGYKDNVGVSADETIRTVKELTLGGFAVQIGRTQNNSRSYVANTQITTLTGTFTHFAARFDNIVPTALSPFNLSLTTDLDNMLTNRDSQTPASRLIPVPAYGEIEERSLMFFVPFKLNAGFILVRVFAINTGKTALQAFSANDFITCNLGGTRYANYDQPAQKKLAVFEYPTTFGEIVSGITVAFPTESFSQTRSGWRDEEAPVAAPFPTVSGSQETAYTTFSFTKQLLGSVFKENFSSGQTARDVSKTVYVTKDYYLVRSSKRK